MADQADGQQPHLVSLAFAICICSTGRVSNGTTSVFTGSKKELELNFRIKQRKRLTHEKREALTVSLEINQVKSMDFMHYQLKDGRTFRLFNVINDYNREAIGMESNLSSPLERMIRELKQMISCRGKPQVIRCVNGQEYISAAIQNWATDRGIKLEYIQPSNQQQNAYVGRFNRTVR